MTEAAASLLMLLTLSLERSTPPLLPVLLTMLLQLLVLRAAALDRLDVPFLQSLLK